jgi:hypothetical protein
MQRGMNSIHGTGRAGCRYQVFGIGKRASHDFTCHTRSHGLDRAARLKGDDPRTYFRVQFRGSS